MEGGCVLYLYSDFTRYCTVESWMRLRTDIGLLSKALLRQIVWAFL